MINQSNPIQVNVSTNFLYANGYKILLFDGDYQPLPIDYWTIRNYELSFNEHATTMKFQIFGLQVPLNIQALRSAKYLKLHFTDLEEKIVATSSFEIAQFHGSLFGDYNSDSLLAYNIELAVK